MDADEVWAHTHEQRAQLLAHLETLSAGEWERDSLCAGWTVREVAAHVISSPQSTPAQVMLGVVRHGGRFNRFIQQEGRRSGARPTTQILDDYRRFGTSRRHPFGTTTVDPLLDVIVHAQDMLIPVGRSHAAPPAAAALAAGRALRLGPFFHAGRRLRGFRLTATDLDWTWGDGAAVHGTMQDLLLLIAGRTATVGRLTGDGARQLAATRQPGASRSR